MAWLRVREAASGKCKMCGVIPRDLGKGAVPAPVASPKPTVWPLDRQSGSLRAPRHPKAKGLARPLEPYLSERTTLCELDADPRSAWTTTEASPLHCGLGISVSSPDSYVMIRCRPREGKMRVY